MIEDLDHPEQWWQEADPCRYKAVEVTDDEVNHAVTMMVNDLHELGEGGSSNDSHTLFAGPNP